MRRAAAVVLLAVVAAVLVLTGASPASAHAYLVGSNPADGDRLTDAPRTLRLHFSEHVVLAATRIEVHTAEGSAVVVGRLRLETADATDTEGPATIVATLPALAGDDAYRVSWETLSSDDLHRTSGLIVFGVGRSVAPARSSTATVRPEEALLRGALLGCIASAVGGLLAQRVLRRSLTGSAAAASVRVVTRVALLGATAAPLLALGLVVGQLQASGSGPGALLLGGYGVRWAISFVGLVLLWSAWRSARARQAPPGRTSLVGAVLACVGTALLGHRGNGDALTVLAASAHVGAALTWGGALASLALALLLRPSDRRVPEARATFHAFGPVAGACLGVVVVTGMWLTSEVVVSVDAALLTTYGRTLLVKVLLVVGAGALGLRHHLRLRGPHDLDLPRRGILVEAGLLLVVVGLTGLLASAATATDPAFVRPASSSAGAVSRQVGDLELTAALSPNRRGRALAVVDVFDTRRPAPGPVVGVDVQLGGAAPVAAQRLVDGRWSAPVVIDRSGPATITATVLRAGLHPTVARFAWTVPGNHGTRQVVVSHAPVGGLLRRADAGLVVVLVVAGAVGARRRTRRRRAASVRNPGRPAHELTPQRR